MATQDTAMVRRPQEDIEHLGYGPRVVPLVDVYENQDEFLVFADVPGVDKERLDVRIDSSLLTVEARQTIATGGDDGSQPMIYARTFALPENIDATKVSAEIDAGVVRIRMPKNEAAKPRRITVEAG